MRAFTFIDISIQTALIGVAMIEIVFATVGKPHGNLDLLLAQIGLALGPWQLFSSLVGSFARLYMKLRVIHLFISSIYLVFFFTDTLSDDTIGFGIPIVLALYCYCVSLIAFKTTRVRTAR